MSTFVCNDLSAEEFAARFPLRQNHLAPDACWDGCLFETFGPELEFVLAQPRAHVWTIVDADGTLVVTSGLWIVNRVGYLLSTVPVPEGHNYDVVLHGEEVQP